MLALWAKTGGGSSLIAAPFVTVNGSDNAADFPTYCDGWSADYSGTPTITTPVPFNVTRQGFTGTDSATTDTHTAVSNVIDTLYVTGRVRAIFSGSTTVNNFYNTYQANRVALNDYIYSTDTVAGAVTNNSTTVSPVPIANWVTPHRQTVGNTLSGEIVAFHRNARAGKQVACVVVTATDGTHTATCTVATPTKSTRTADLHPVIVYAWSLDISTFTDAHLVTVNAKVYPWIGADPASVADSSTGTAGSGRDFGPRYYLKDTTKAATPLYAYLSAGGVDATGVFSTTAATAATTPFLTVAGVMNKINSGSTGSPGQADGVIVLVGSGTFVMGTTTSNVNQHVSCITFTRDSLVNNVARASAFLTWGAAVFQPKLAANITAPITTGCIRLTDVSETRTGVSAITGETAAHLEYIRDDVTYDNGATTNANPFNKSDMYTYGAVASNLGVSTYSGSASGQHRIIRGLSSTTGTPTIDPWLLLGSSIATPILNMNIASISGGVCAFNVFPKLPSASIAADIALSQDVTGYALVQNVFEYIATGNQAAIRVSGDSATGNTSHIIAHHNTAVGYYIGGRNNWFYDEGATRRSNVLQSCKGNFWTQVNCKSDVFVGLNNGGTPSPTEAPFRIQDWGYTFGVGCQGEFSNYGDANTGGVPPTSDFGPQYFGIGSLSGTSTTVPQCANAKFTAYAATTWSGSGTTPTAGTGNGTYSWASTSPVKGIVSDAVLSYDLAGTARAAVNDDASAYVSP